GDHDEQRLLHVTAAGRIDVDVRRVHHLDGGPVLDDLLDLDLLRARLYGHGELTSLLVQLDGCLDFRWSLLVERAGISRLQFQRLLEDFQILRRLHLEVLPHGHLFENLSGSTLPAETHDARALVHGRTHVVVDELHAVDLGAELPVQDQLVLLRNLVVLERGRRYLEQLVGAEEWLGQGRVTPLRLTTDQLRLHRRAALDLWRLGRTTHFQQVVPV